MKTIDSLKERHSDSFLIFISEAQTDEERVLQYLVQNEDELLTFVAQVNKVYQERLNKPAPFMTFILIGMQSSAKSTLIERYGKRNLSFW